MKIQLKNRVADRFLKPVACEHEIVKKKQVFGRVKKKWPGHTMAASYHVESEYR